jgi:hypothetical protein
MPTLRAPSPGNPIRPNLNSAPRSAVLIRSNNTGVCFVTKPKSKALTTTVPVVEGELVAKIDGAPYVKGVKRLYKEACAADDASAKAWSALGEFLLPIKKMIEAKNFYIKDERVRSFKSFVEDHCEASRTTAYKCLSVAEGGQAAIEDQREKQRELDRRKDDKLRDEGAAQAEPVRDPNNSNIVVGQFEVGGQTFVCMAGDEPDREAVIFLDQLPPETKGGILFEAAQKIGERVVIHRVGKFTRTGAIRPTDKKYPTPVAAEGSTGAVAEVVEAPPLAPEAEPEPPRFIHC